VHSFDLTGETDAEMIEIITPAGRTAEKWDEAKIILRLERSLTETRSAVQDQKAFKTRKQFNDKTQQQPRFKPRNSWSGKGEKSCTQKNRLGKTYSEQINVIDKSELDRTKSAGDWQQCVWPADGKGCHKTIDCYQPQKTDKETATFPNANEYQKFKTGAYEQHVSEIDLYTTVEQSGEDSADESRDDISNESGEEDESEHECLGDEHESDEEASHQYEQEKNSWDSDSEYNPHYTLEVAD